VLSEISFHRSLRLSYPMAHGRRVSLILVDLSWTTRARQAPA
jgi:hypothetical protein